MGKGNALLNPPLGRAGKVATVTVNSDAYESASDGRGLGGGTGETFHDAVVAGDYTAAELAQFKYVYAPDAQIATAAIRSPDETNWETLKAAYSSQGLDRPRRLLVTRHDILRWNLEGLDYYLDGNIHDAGPMWNVATIDNFPGDAIGLPPASALDTGYWNQEGSGLTFQEAKAILDANGFTWANYDVTKTPHGADVVPYEFQNPSAKQFRFNGSIMDIDDDDWVESIADLLIAHLEATDLPELDGILCQFPKAYQYVGYRGGTGLPPNNVSSGLGVYMLEYWVRTSLVNQPGGVDITAASTTDPVVLTVVGHGLSDNDQIHVSGVVGMEELNQVYDISKVFYVDVLSVDTLALYSASGPATSVNGEGYAEWTSGGTISSIQVPYDLDNQDVAAPAFAASTDYSVGDRVTAGGKIYTNVLDKGNSVDTPVGYRIFTGTNITWRHSPDFPVTAAHVWDHPNVTAYEYFEGMIKLAIELRSRLPAGKELHWCLCHDRKDVGIWQYGDSIFRRGWRNDYIALNGGTPSQQEAQTALLAKVMELRSYCDGLIIPSSAQTTVDEADGTVTIEPVGWWESLADKPMKIQYAYDP